MRWILDSCTLIYLIKAKLFNQFIEIVEFPVVIDSSVYQEVVINGKAKLVKENPVIEEVDINPLAVLEKGVLALDARVLL